MLINPFKFRVKAKGENKKFTASNAADFKDASQRLVEIELVTHGPDGKPLKAIVQRPSLMGLVKAGRVPNPLLGVVMGSLDGQMPVDDTAEAVDVMNLTIMSALVEPKCVWENPTDDEICVTDLADPDKMLIIATVYNDILGYAPFRRKR